MKSRILTIALALSLLATVFVAFPTKAAYEYTGSVATTSDTGAPKYVYIQGEQVYVNVEVRYRGELSPEDIRVRLQPAGSGWTSQFTAVANDPVDGWYNSSEAASGLTLSTTGFWIYEERACYVIAYERWSMTELGRTTITVLEAGIEVDPDPITIEGYGTVGYYPGQTLDISVTTTWTTDMFYVQIVNETGTTVQNWTAQIAPNGYWHATWTIPTTLPNGDYTIYVRDASTHATWPHSYDFEVRAYVFEAIPDREAYLPGETAEISLISLDVATLAPATGLTVTYCAHWYNASDGDQWLNGTLPSASGTHEFAIPATDIATWWGIEITYWANQSTIRSEESDVWLDFQKIAAYVNTNWGGYAPGDFVAVTVGATIGGDPLPGATVDVKVTKNGTEIAAYGTTGLTTDVNGEISYGFTLVAEAAIGVYTIEATVTKVGFSTVAATNFEVYEWGYLSIRFDKDYYISGETIGITFEAFWQGQEVSAGTIMVYVETDFDLLTVGNTSTMSFSVQLPADYVGNIRVAATAYYNDKVLSTSAVTWVVEGGLLVTVDKDTYMPGDTLTFTWNVFGPVTAGTLSYQLWAGSVMVETASPAFTKTGTITVDVPETDPAWGYGVWMYLMTSSGVFSESSAEAYMVGDGTLRAWAEKSNYADGSFKPGQTVKIRYEIFNFWTDPLPVYQLVISCDYDPAAMSVFVSEEEGVVEYVLPSDAPSGMVDIDVELWDPVEDSKLSDATISVVVSNQLSAWDRNLGGMAAVDLLIVLLLVVMIIVLIVMPFIKGRQPKATAPAEEPPPPAEPPKP